MKTLRFIVFCGLYFASLQLFAQHTPTAIKADLVKSFKRIDNWSGNNISTGVSDSLWNAKYIVGEKLQSYAEKHPFTISYPFSLLKKEHVDINTSSDGLFRIYSWETWTGGTMHFFESVFQYKVGTKTYAVLDTPKTEGDNRPSIWLPT